MPFLKKAGSLAALVAGSCAVAAAGVRGQTPERDLSVSTYPGVNVASGDANNVGTFFGFLNAETALNVTVRLGSGSGGTATPAADTAGGVVMGIRQAANYGTANAGLASAHTTGARFDGILMSDRTFANIEANSAIFGGTGENDGTTLFLPNTASKRDPFTCGFGDSITLGNRAEQIQFYESFDNTTGVSAWGDTGRLDPTSLYLEEGRNPRAGIWTGTKNFRIVAPLLRSHDKMNYGTPTADFLALLARQMYWASDLNDAPSIDADDHVLPAIEFGATSQEITVSALLAAVNYADADADMGYCVYSGVILEGQVVTANSTWEYWDDRDTTWRPVTNFNLHVPAEGRLRLVAGSSAAGENALQFAAWDSTSVGSTAAQASSELVYGLIFDWASRGRGGRGAASANTARLVVQVNMPTTGTTGSTGSTGIPGTTGTTNVPSSTGTTGVSTGVASPAPQASSSSGSGGDEGTVGGLELWLIIVIAAGAAVCCCLLIAGVCFATRRRGSDSSSSKSSTAPEEGSSSSSHSAKEEVVVYGSVNAVGSGDSSGSGSSSDDDGEAQYADLAQFKEN